MNTETEGSIAMRSMSRLMTAATAIAALCSPALAADAAMTRPDDLRDPVGHADQEMMSTVNNGLDNFGAGSALIDRGDTIDDDPASGVRSTTNLGAADLGHLSRT